VGVEADFAHCAQRKAEKDGHLEVPATSAKEKRRLGCRTPRTKMRCVLQSGQAGAQPAATFTGPVLNAPLRCPRCAKKISSRR